MNKHLNHGCNSMIQQDSTSSLVCINLNNCLQSLRPVYLKDKSGIYLNCNIYWAEKFSLSSPQDVIGKSDYDLFKDNNEINLIHQNDAKLLKSESPDVFRETITFQDMQTCSMLIYKLPFKNHTDEIIGILGTSISIEQVSTSISLDQEGAHLSSKPVSHSQSIENPKLANKNISKREKECLYYLIRGMTAKEIGRILNLSSRTIEFYIENMKKKFSCSNRIDLIAKAYDILEIE